MTPIEIEQKSMDIIECELQKIRNDIPKRGALEDAIVRRVIHASADFDFSANIVFTHNAAECALCAMREGALIVTDTLMALSGINKRCLALYGGSALCFIADEDVAQAARKTGTTRSARAVDKARETAASKTAPLIFAVGNAPTALMRICELVKAGSLKPAAVIAAPVGFVNVVEAKEAMLELDIPCIIARGRKGGSPIAAAIINALLYYKEG